MSAGISVAEARAPYVSFEQRAVEDRAASIEKGVYTTKDVDYALVTPQGSKDQIERVAIEWLAHIKQESQGGRFPTEWVKAYNHAYSEWKEGREIPVDGTSIMNWGVPSPAQRDALKSLKIRSVEDMAGANEEAIQRIGMGGIQLRKLAQDFLQAAAAGGPAKLAAEVAEMRGKLAAMELTNSQLLEANTRLRADFAQAKTTESALIPQTRIPVSELFDEDVPVRTSVPALRKL